MNYRTHEGRKAIQDGDAIFLRKLALHDERLYDDLEYDDLEERYFDAEPDLDLDEPEWDPEDDDDEEEENEDAPESGPLYYWNRGAA